MLLGGDRVNADFAFGRAEDIEKELRNSDAYEKAVPTDVSGWYRFPFSHRSRVLLLVVALQAKRVNGILQVFHARVPEVRCGSLDASMRARQE